jgi:predicted Fe-Mo cluster-binding NifX family protein
MKIAFTAKGTEWDSPIDPRFGRAEFLIIYDEDTDTLSHYDNRAIANVGHGAGPQTAQKLFELQADLLITGNGPGGNAATVLNKAGMKILTGAGDFTIKQALEAYKNNQLKKA